MADEQLYTTSITLLASLADAADQQAWNRFVEQYSPRIFFWCRRFGLQETDAADVTQDVLLKLLGAMREHQYDPARGSFRGWLKTVTANLIRDLKRASQPHDQGSGDTRVMRQLAAIQDGPAFQELEMLLEKQYEEELLSLAKARVRQRVQPQTWQAFQMYACDRIPARQVADTLKMPVGEVYVAKSRTIKLLQQEIRKLDEKLDAGFIEG